MYHHRQKLVMVAALVHVLVSVLICLPAVVSSGKVACKLTASICLHYSIIQFSMLLSSDEKQRVLWPAESELLSCFKVTGLVAAQQALTVVSLSCVPLHIGGCLLIHTMSFSIISKYKWWSIVGFFSNRESSLFQVKVCPGRRPAL